MQIINIHEAKTHLSRLVEQAAAGESFVIAKAGRPMVRVTALEPEASGQPHRTRLGFLRGHVQVPDDFDTLGQDEVLDAFGLDRP